MGTLHTRFSVNLSKCRTLPSSAHVPPGLSGRGLLDKPTSRLTIRHRSLARLYTRSLSQSYTFESHNNSLNRDNTRYYINSRTILVNRNTITNRLYLILSKHVYSLQEYTPDWLTPPCHRKRPPPVRRQSPTTTTWGCYATPDHCLWPVSRIIHNPQLQYPNIYIQSSDRYIHLTVK